MFQKELKNYQVQHWELFLSKDIETVDIKLVRSKCLVVSDCKEIFNYEDFKSENDLFYVHFTYKSTVKLPKNGNHEFDEASISKRKNNYFKSIEDS